MHSEGYGSLLVSDSVILFGTAVLAPQRTKCLNIKMNRVYPMQRMT